MSNQVPISLAPASEHTPAYKIFRYPFRCQVAAMHMISQEYMEKLGIVTTGDQETDLQLLRAPRDVQLTIAQMAEMYYEGVSIQLYNPVEDSVKIYTILVDHLNDWKQRVALSPHLVKDSVVEDLKKLDELAIEVYKTAKMYLPKTFEQSKLFRRLGGLGGGLGAGMSNRVAAVSRPTAAPRVEKPLVAAEHNPIAEAISRAVFNRRAQE